MTSEKYSKFCFYKISIFIVYYFSSFLRENPSFWRKKIAETEGFYYLGQSNIIFLSHLCLLLIVAAYPGWIEGHL
jgi:hypothetical protein